MATPVALVVARAPRDVNDDYGERADGAELFYSNATIAAARRLIHRRRAAPQTHGTSRQRGQAIASDARGELVVDPL